MAETKYKWTDNPTESGIAKCDTDVLNDCLMYLKYENSSTGYEVGDIIFRTLPTNDASKHLLDGTVLDGNGIYKGFVDYIKGLYNASPTASYFATETDWQSSVTQYGVCGKFVYNASANTVRLPKVTGIVEGTIDANALGDLVEAGLPNIYSNNMAQGSRAYPPNGAVYAGDEVSNIQSGTNIVFTTRNLDASLSSPIYGNSDTVQPQTIKGYYYIVVATSTKTDIEVDIDNVVTDINGINTRCQILEDTTLKENQITNCLLEVPQNIKLELSNGAITLKAGSKVIIPNGFEADGTTKKFDELIIDRDINNGGQTSNNTWFMCYNTVADFTNVRTVSSSFSGDTQPTSSAQYQAWYDTANNIMKFTSDSWATWQKTSLPICICTSANEASYTSIDQVFNGFSYIGNHCFILPNVKGLIPNGRNEDGSLRNIEYTQQRVKAEHLANNSIFYIGVGLGTSQSNNYVEQEEEPTSNYTLWYKPSENKMYRKSGSGVVGENRVIYGFKVITGSNGIINFQPKQAFRAVDYSDYVITPRIIETYANGTSWYRIYSDGWIEQGGRLLSGTEGEATATLLKTMKNTNYCCQITLFGDSSAYGSAAIASFYTAWGLTTTSFKYRRYKANTMQHMWQVSGYMA
jgi:hypothetical protein